MQEQLEEFLYSWIYNISCSDNSLKHKIQKNFFDNINDINFLIEFFSVHFKYNDLFSRTY